MSGIIIHRSVHTQQYVVIGNDLARNSLLSFRARGLLVMLLSLPPEWHVTTDMLAEDNPDSRTAIRAAMAELRQFGYVLLVTERGADGRTRRHLEVFDVPQPSAGRTAVGATCENSASPQVAPTAGKPAVGIPAVNRSTGRKYGSKVKTAAGAPFGAPRAAGTGVQAGTVTSPGNAREATHPAGERLPAPPQPSGQAASPARQHWRADGFRVGVLIYKSDRWQRCDACGQPGAIHWVHADGKAPELEGFTASAHYCDQHRPARGPLPDLDYTRTRMAAGLSEHEHLRPVAGDCDICGDQSFSSFQRWCHSCDDPSRWRVEVTKVITRDGDRTDTRDVHDPHKTGEWTRCPEHREQLLDTEGAAVSQP